MLLVIGDLLGGQQGLMIAFVFAAIMNFGSYWFSDKIVLRMYRAQEVGSEHPLYQMTERLSRAGRPADAEGLHHSGPVAERVRDRAQPAARGGGGDRRASCRSLSEHELEGVIAHELAHVKHRDILISSVAATIAAAIMMVGAHGDVRRRCSAGGRDDRDGGSNPIALLAMMILAPMAAMLIQMAISRSREFAADAGGARSPATRTGLPMRCARSTRSSKRVPLDANPATAHMFIVKPFSGRRPDVALQHAIRRPKRASRRCSAAAGKQRTSTLRGWRAIPRAIRDRFRSRRYPSPHSPSLLFPVD